MTPEKTTTPIKAERTNAKMPHSIITVLTTIPTVLICHADTQMTVPSIVAQAGRWEIATTWLQASRVHASKSLRRIA